MRTSRRLRRAATTAAATTAVLALVAPAQAADLGHDGGSRTPAASPAYTSAVAGTIVFVRDHDVWVARADGTGARAVTTDGTASAAYHTPTQSDGGVIAAGRGQLIVRMTQHGRVLNTIDPEPMLTSVGHPVDGVPVDVAISPDGDRIAYSFYTYQCPVGTSCGQRYVTGYTAADRYTPPAPHGTSYFNSPSWVTSDRTVEGGGFGSQINLHQLGQDPVHWFDDSAHSTDWQDWEDLSEPDVSPDGTRLAVVRSYGDEEHIAFYEVVGDVRTEPSPRGPDRHCMTNEQPGFEDPTWSADSSTVAWEEPTGVWMSADPVPGCVVQPRLVLPGASEPDFSAADLQDRPVPIRSTARPVVRGTPRVGSVLTATSGSWSPQPTTVRYRWSRNGTPVSGATTARYRLTRRDAGASVRVSVTATRAGSQATAVSKAVSVRR